MNNKSDIIPKKLKKEPLIEALFELRFTSEKNSVSDLLPGLIFEKLSDRFSKVEKLPASDLPAVVLNDPNMRYVATIKLSGEEPYCIMIGEHVLSLCCSMPYTGWNSFLALIIELLNVVNKTSLITNTERISLKYSDVLEEKDGFTLEDLKLDLQIAGNRIVKNPMQLRAELNDDNFINIMQIAYPSEVTLNTGKKFNGLLLVIDTISKKMPDNFWTDPKVFLDTAHAVNKSTFLNLLKPETITRLEPES
jgi:uncharacterized protein (TIGR04255 family)